MTTAGTTRPAHLDALAARPNPLGRRVQRPALLGAHQGQGPLRHLDGWLGTDRNGHVRLELIVDAASLNTGNRKRDQHLRSADFFDTQHHPELRFQSVIAGDAGNGRPHVEGELVGDDNSAARFTFVAKPGRHR